MKIFIFKRIDRLTTNYHEEGGLVVVADGKLGVENLIEQENSRDDRWRNYADIYLTEEDWENVVSYQLPFGPKPAIWLFPDAGCCQ